ncbi:GspE/PulE family protein [Novipirellula artificiosorum]|uniref:Putative type II secretion system protein E n=1 Tax=Novipirellula artificiosorum TaxID=2528016 RepID=A0A5C6D905_9BACT|nr:ATPase, T2SS/T4P/T4SS family [Novipirellula artificiosorum]TWU32281.1 putative type II secretion system protein E [Novipirellula artificiosorum]
MNNAMTPIFSLPIHHPSDAGFSDGFDDNGFAVLAPNHIGSSPQICHVDPQTESSDPDSTLPIFEATNETSLDEAKRYAKHYLLPLFDPPSNEPLPINPDIHESLPSKWCRIHRITPLSDDGKTLEVAITKPDSLLLADEVRTLTGRQMRPFFAPTAVVDRLLSTLYPMCEDSQTSEHLQVDDRENSQAVASVNSDTGSCSLSLPQAASIPPTSALSDESLGRVLRHLVQGFVEQILIEPIGKAFRIRARHGSGMYELETLDRSAGKRLISQVLSRVGCDAPFETTLIASGQTGEFRVRYNDHRVPIRATFCPAVGGAMVSMVRGKTTSTPRRLRELGFQPTQYDCFHSVLHQKSGLVLIAGPRRSGKTTTFYSALADRKTPEVHVCSVEDAAWVDVEGVNQLSLCELPGMSKAEAIELVSAQLPDVVAIDRLDDHRTAAMAIQLATEGCLVVATIHSRDAASAVARMNQLGVDPGDLAKALSVVVAQKRVGRLCPHCRHDVPLSAELASRLKLEPNQQVAWPSGCATCGQVGYQGNVTAMEVVPIDSSARSAIRQNNDPNDFYASAVAAGLPRIHDVLVKHLLAGDVTADALN